jgi:hypothetical protein
LKNALSVFKTALQSDNVSLGNIHQDVAFILTKLGNVCYEMQEPTLALKYYHDVLKIQNAILDPSHPQIIIALNIIAHIEVRIKEVY